MKVEVVAPNPLWPAMFRSEARLIRAGLGSNVTRIEHIGSTAIHGIFAKPIIDMLLSEAQAYGALKRKLALAHPDSIEAYMDGKDSFVKDRESRALAWRAPGR